MAETLTVLIHQVRTMSKEVRSIVITGNGTNCEMEMAHACRLAGSEVVDIVHIS